MFLRRKKGLEIVVADLEQDERELLLSSLRSSLSGNVVLSGDRVFVDSGQLSLEELRRLVNKFVYHRNLNGKYWVAVKGSSVRMGRFEKARKSEKRRREATKPQTITHGW